MSQVEFEKLVLTSLAEIKILLANQIESNKDHEKRIRAVESECKLYRGAWAVAAAIFGWLGFHVVLH